MLLSEYAPRPRLRLPRTLVERPATPVIDAHNHLGPAFSGIWATRPVGAVIDALDEAGVELVVDLDGGQGGALSGRIER